MLTEPLLNEYTVIWDTTMHDFLARCAAYIERTPEIARLRRAIVFKHADHRVLDPDRLFPFDKHAAERASIELEEKLGRTWPIGTLNADMNAFRLGYLYLTTKSKEKRQEIAKKKNFPIDLIGETAESLGLVSPTPNPPPPPTPPPTPPASVKAPPVNTPIPIHTSVDAAREEMLKRMKPPNGQTVPEQSDIDAAREKMLAGLRPPVEPVPAVQPAPPVAPVEKRVEPARPVEKPVHPVEKPVEPARTVEKPLPPEPTAPTSLHGKGPEAVPTAIRIIKEQMAIVNATIIQQTGELLQMRTRLQELEADNAILKAAIDANVDDIVFRNEMIDHLEQEVQQKKATSLEEAAQPWLDQYPELKSVLGQVRRNLARNTEKQREVKDRLPKEYHWGENTLMPDYGPHFIRALMELSMDDQLRILKAVEMMVPGAYNGSLQPKTLVREVPHTPKGAKFSRATGELRFSWSHNKGVVHFYYIFRPPDMRGGKES